MDFRNNGFGATSFGATSFGATGFGATGFGATTTLREKLKNADDRLMSKTKDKVLSSYVHDIHELQPALNYMT